jgi:hypothetical protein
MDNNMDNKKNTEEDNYEKELTIILNYENNPNKCQAESYGCHGICKDNVIEREFVCQYKPNPGMKYKKMISFCDFHYFWIMTKNNGISPEPYYEHLVGEAVYELISKYM